MNRAPTHRRVSIDLDPVSPLADLVPHNTNQGVDPISLLGALGNSELRGKPFGRVATGGHDRTSHDQHPRPGNNALADCLLEPNIGVPGPFRSQIADRCEAGSSVLRRWLVARQIRNADASFRT